MYSWGVEGKPKVVKARAVMGRDVLLSLAFWESRRRCRMDHHFWYLRIWETGQGKVEERSAVQVWGGAFLPSAMSLMLWAVQPRAVVLFGEAEEFGESSAN